MRTTEFYQAPIPAVVPFGVMGLGGLAYGVGYAMRETPRYVNRAFQLRFLGIALMVLAVLILLIWLFGLFRKSRPDIRVDAEGIAIGSKSVMKWPDITGVWIQVTEDRNRTDYTLVVEAKGLDKSGGPGQGLGTRKVGVNDLLESSSKQHASPDAILAFIGEAFRGANGKDLPQRRMKRMFERN